MGIWTPTKAVLERCSEGALRALQGAHDRLFHGTDKSAVKHISGNVATVIEHVKGGAILRVIRPVSKGMRRATRVEQTVRMGPNHVHAFITHVDGSITDLGVSRNLLTTMGRDWLCQSLGGFIPAGGAGSPATATSATSITATATPWTSSNLPTTLGLAGLRVYASVTAVTTAPVYGNITSNTTSVATIDQWWTAVDGVGTTPASTNAFIIGAGGLASARFMALTTDASAASSANTALASEISTNGGSRALATYAHTLGGATATFTLQKAYAISGTLTAIHRMGLFASLTSATGPMLFETVLNQDATVGNGDTLTCVRGDTRIITKDRVAAIRDLAGSHVEVLNRFGQWEASEVKSFGIQRLHRVDFAYVSPVYATADHRWWQRDGTRVKTTELKRVPFTRDETAHAEVKSVADTGIDEEVFCCVVPGSESFTLANGLLTSNCTDTMTVSG